MMSWNELFRNHCTKHQFKLIPADHKIKDKESAFAYFCCYGGENNKNDPLYDCHFADLPVFNHDRNYASATFILQGERQNFNKNSEISLQKQWGVIASQYCEKSIDQIAQPRRKNNYCSVCKVYYEDYFKHVQRNKHKFQTKKSSFNKDIQDLTQLIRMRTFKSSLQGQKDQQAFDSTLCSIENQPDSIEIIQMPKKKIKCNEKSDIITQEKLLPIPFKEVQLEIDCAKEFVRIFRGQQKQDLIKRQNQQHITSNKFPPLSSIFLKQHNLKNSSNQKYSKKGIQKDLIPQYIIIDD